MIKIENYQILGWKPAIRGMRNPMNSWDKSDSSYCAGIGSNDLDLMTRLAKAGPVHAKYRRMIVVYVDITAPLYWWKEFDTYKVGTVANSCSTMHKIHAKEFTLEDFSCEHLMKAKNSVDEETVSVNGLACTSVGIFEHVINALNLFRMLYLKTNEKKYWWQMIQLLPSSYNQKRTVMLNYEVLASIYRDRRNHKLDEWRELCNWIETLPYSEIILASKQSGCIKDETYITDHDRIVMSAYTGFLMCDFDDYHELIEETLGRQVYMYELENESIREELRERLKPEFLEIVGESAKKE